MSFARSDCEVREAQRLRYKVFAEEMGARVIYDAFCEHLLVRDTDNGEVVGTCAMPPWKSAARA